MHAKKKTQKNRKSRVLSCGLVSEQDPIPARVVQPRLPVIGGLAEQWKFIRHRTNAHGHVHGLDTVME